MNATCQFCGATTDLGNAVDEGWIPYFYRGRQESTGPACPPCAALHLTRADDDEYEIGIDPNERGGGR